MPSNRAFLRKITELGLDPKIPYVPGPNGIPVPKSNLKNVKPSNHEKPNKEEMVDTKDELIQTVVENLIVENEVTNEIIEQVQETENLPSVEAEGNQEEVQQPKKKNNPFKKKIVTQE